MNDKAIDKMIFRLQPNLFITSMMPKVIKCDTLYQAFIQYIIDSFRYSFNKTLDKDDVISINNLIELLKNIMDLKIGDKIEELKQNPRNRQIQGALKLALENKEGYINSIENIKKKNQHLSGLVNSIYEIGNGFIADDINNAIEERGYFRIPYRLKRIYKTDGKCTTTKPDKRDKNQKIYFNSPEELYENAIDNLEELKGKDSMKLMPLNFSSDKFETKKILNTRKERNADLRRFICFLNFYLYSLERIDKAEINYYIFIILILSPFADYVANNIKYSKEVLKLCIKKVGIEPVNTELIFKYFNNNYDGQSIEDNDDIKDKPSKELYAFFDNYLKGSETLKEEYDEFKKEFYEHKEHYIAEIEKFYYKQKENSYESELTLTNGITQIIREFPAEEADNISEFLNKRIPLLYPNNSNNKKEYLIKDNFKYPELINIPKIQETLKLFKYTSPDEIKEIPLKLVFKRPFKIPCQSGII